jgi:hypothetical protein
MMETESFSETLISNSTSTRLIAREDLLAVLKLLLAYSGRRITLSFSYVTERGEGKMERARGSKSAKSLSEHVLYI